MDGMFVRKDEARTGSSVKGTAPDGVKGAYNQTYVNDDPDEYEVGMLLGLGDGTRVPRVSEHGGIMNHEDNPYGMVVRGVVMKLDKDKGVCTRTPVALSHLKKVQPQEASDLAVNVGLVGESLLPEDIQIHDQPGTDEIVAEVADEVPSENARQSADLTELIESFERPAQEMPAVVPQKPLCKVRLSGSFGTYRGNYLDIVVEPRFVILLCPLDGNSYTPPESPDVLRLEVLSGGPADCVGQLYSVYFAGIEFDLPSAGAGIQVFLRDV